MQLYTVSKRIVGEDRVGFKMNDLVGMIRDELYSKYDGKMKNRLKF